MCLIRLALLRLHQAVKWRGKISLETIGGNPQPLTAFIFPQDLPLQSQHSPAQTSNAGEGAFTTFADTQQGNGRADAQLKRHKIK